MDTTQTKTVVEPKTTGELFKHIGKKLPMRLLKTLPIAITVALVSWLVHTFLLVGPNGGFAPDTWLANNILNVKGKMISSTLLWAMLGGIFTLMISSIIQKRNPFKTFGEMFRIPGNIVKKNKAMGNTLLPVLLVVCGVTLLFEKLLSGIAGIAAGGILLSSVAALVLGTGGIFAMIFRMIFNDIQAFVLKKQKMKMDNEAVYMILGASGLTFVVFGLLKSSNVIFRIFGLLGGLAGRILPFFGAVFIFLGMAINVILSWAWAILLLIGIVMVLTKKTTVPKTLVFFALFFVSLAAAQKFFGIQIFADDGGWAEAGSTFKSWSESEGALEAVLRGFPPAVAGVVGSNVAAVVTGTEVDGVDVSNDFVDSNIEDGPIDDRTYEEERDDSRVPTDEDPESNLEKAKRDYEEAMERGRLEREARDRENQQQQQAAQDEIDRINRERDEHFERLAKKYNTTPDKLRDVLQQNMDDSAAEADKWRKIDKVLAVGEVMAKGTVIVGDTLIDGMAEVAGPGGKAVRATYKVVKGVAQTTAEKGFTSENIIGGVVAGGTDAATDFIKNPYAKAATTVAGQTLSGAITDGEQGAKDGFVNGVFKAGTDALTDKLAGDGFGNEMTSKINADGTATVAIKTEKGWVEKNVSETVATKFYNSKVTKQINTSTIKAASGMANDFGAQPVLKDAGILP